VIFRQVENFFPRLDILIPEIKKFKFLDKNEHNKDCKEIANWPGLRTKNLETENVFLYEYINTLIFFNYKIFDLGAYHIKTFAHLRLKEDDDKDWIHKDSEDYAGLIYLGDTNLNAGTRLYDEKSNIINDIKYVKNRAIFYSGSYPHKGYGHFGSSVQDGRLTLNVFITKAKKGENNGTRTSTK
jgi:hypothetical protein|tara:strand:+ start:48 stop:599 length:552 start_codon:yes stop_codon:yes gene_type:complete